MNRKQLLAIFAVGTFFGFGLQLLLDQAEKEQIEAAVEDMSKRVREMEGENNRLTDENNTLTRTVRSEQMKLSSLADRLHYIEGQKLQQYMTLTDVRKKLEIADDILGEIFVTFMSQIALNPKPESIKYFEGKTFSGTNESLRDQKGCARIQMTKTYRTLKIRV